MHAGLNSTSDKLQQGLEALLVEVNGLANRLKASNPREAIPSASRGVLQILQRGGAQTVPQIARTRFSSRQNIQIVVNRLQKEGLVEFADNPHHKRSVLVRLTHRGQLAIAEAAKEEAELNTRVLPSFSQTELSSAAEVLNKLRRMLDGKEMPEAAPKQMDREASRERIEQMETSPAKAGADGGEKAGASPDETVLADTGLPVNLL